MRSAARWLAGGVGLVGGAYAAYVLTAWFHYGHVPRRRSDATDDLLDTFMPVYDVVERHHVHVAAPAGVTLAAAQELELGRLPVVRAIMKGRELILGSTPDHQSRPTGLLAEMQSLGWRVLTAIPGREIVVGAVTKPWEADVTFRPLPPNEFAAFREPDYVKIAWTLRADAISAKESIFRTETRALATDATARRKFRRYWSLLSPGIILIRWASLRPIKKNAERRFREATHMGPLNSKLEGPTTWAPKRPDVSLS